MVFDRGRPQDILNSYLGEEAAAACRPKQLVYSLGEEEFNTPRSLCN